VKARRSAPSAETECVAADAIALERAVADAVRVVRYSVSNSAIFFIPAARFCARVLAFLFASNPDEGWAERREAHW
jgi:hypothetical protein